MPADTPILVAEVGSSFQIYLPRVEETVSKTTADAPTDNLRGTETSCSSKTPTLFANSPTLSLLITDSR